MRNFVHFLMVMMLLSIALTAVGPLVAQEPVAVEEVQAEAEAGPEDAEADAEAETEGEHAVAVENAPEARSSDHSDHSSTPGATDNTPIALLLTGMILLFAVGAVAIRRL